MLALITLSAAVAFMALSIPVVRLAMAGTSQFQDDAFYYIVPARHFLEMGQFTFDGTTPTNGFHPLWMAIIVSLLSTLGPSAGNATVILSVTLVERTLLGLAIGLCSWLAFRSAKDRLPWTLGFLSILLLLCHPGHVVFQQGMETTLAALLYIGIIGAFTFQRWRTLGILCGLITLCRLDAAVFVCVPLIVYAWITGSVGMRRCAAIALPSLAAALGVMLLNYVLLGDVRPVSGAIKSSFPHVTWHGGYLLEPLNIARMAGWSILVKELNLILCVGIFAGGLSCLLRLPRSRERRLAGGIAITVACLLGNLLLFQRWEKSIDPRYLVLPTIGALFLLGTAMDAYFRRTPQFLTTSPSATARSGFGLMPCVLLLTALIFMARAAVVNVPSYRISEDLVRGIFGEIAQSVPPDAVIAATDSGALAFWTGRRIVNLDGLMNDYAYQSYLRDGQLGAYLRKQGVTHIATALWDRPQAYTARPTEPMYQHQVDAAATSGTAYACHWYYVYSYVYAVFSDRICLKPEQEVFRRAVGKDGIADASYVVYRLDP